MADRNIVNGLKLWRNGPQVADALYELLLNRRARRP